MAGYGDRMRRAVPVVATARQARIPVICAIVPAPTGMEGAS